MRLIPLLLSLLIPSSWVASIAAPVNARTITLVDYAFVGLPSSAVTSSATPEQWTIRNDARALHQVQVLQLPDSSLLPAVDQWIARGASSLTPPAPLVVNVPALLPGASTFENVRLEPGVYAVLCFVPAGRDTSGALVTHAHLGMRQTFVVRP